MGSESLLTAVSLCATCTGFFLFLTVLLAANNFLKAGTVGKMSVTFYCLASFNGCMWAAYGVLLGSATITLPNAWSLLTTTFAIVSYFSVLGKEVAAAKAKASNPITPDSSTTLHSALGAVVGCPTTTIVKIVGGEIVGGEGAGASVGRSDKIGGGFENSSEGASVGEAAGPHLSFDQQEPSSISPAVLAEQLSVRYQEAKKTLIVVQIANVCTLMAILFFALASKDTSTALSISGTIGVAMATLLFAGPLDQVSWIVKNKNSIPLDPLMTIVGTFNAFMWGVFGFLTHDFFVICPNVVALALCILQLGLIVKFPRVKVVE